MDSVLRTMLEAGLQAPSGENAQPWRFRVSDGTILLFNHEESDQSLYNFNGYGSLVCEGACIENMVIAGEALGKSVTVQLFPDTTNKNLVAELKVKEGKPNTENAEALAHHIPTRTTNRKQYSKTPLGTDEGRALEVAAGSFVTKNVGFKRITSRKDIVSLAPFASTNEKIMLGNQELHHFFFSHLTWSEKEDTEKKVGFFIKTLELPPPIQGLFRIFAKWSVMKILKTIGFTSLVGKGNAQTYASSSEMGLLTVSSMNREQFVNVGRAFQRIWLTAESIGLSIQPLTGTIFMNFFAENVSEGHFSKTERVLLQKQMSVIRKFVQPSTNIPVVLYRIGKAPKASARARRFDLKQLMV